MSRKSIEDSIHQAKPDSERKGKRTLLDGIDISRKQKGADKPVVFAFGPKGQIVEDRDKAFAYYSETAEGTRTYFVKFAIAGPAQGRMLNVNGVGYQKGDENRYEKSLGRMRYEFREVNQKIFDLYVNFLKTLNEKYILQAEREVVNA